jgi:CBS domain-containing protein
MKVKELMTREVVTIPPETSLKEVAATLAREGVSGLPVCDVDGRVLGVVSEGDILYKEQSRPDRRGGPLARLVDGGWYAAAAKGAARTAGEAMTAPAVTIGPDRPVAAAARMMVERQVNRLPVVKDGQLFGIVTRADLVRAFTRSDDDVAAEIREHVLRRALWVEPGTIEVAVENGEVTLRGALESRSDVRLLSKLTARVPGVVTVRTSVRWRVDDTKRAFAGTR